jgi:hypothetical protein
MQLRSRTGPVQVTRCPGSVPGACFAARSPLDQVPSLHPLRCRSLGLVHGLHRYYAPVRLLATVHHRLRLIAFPMRAVRISACRSVARPPRFRRVPFLRDVFFDHGRASAPRIAVPHMLPSTLLTVSASATLELSRLNSTPHRIVVYASQPTSPPTTQHSLPGARYGLPVPVFHRLDRASFAWRTSNLQHSTQYDGDCRVGTPRTLNQAAVRRLVIPAQGDVIQSDFHACGSKLPAYAIRHLRSDI